MLTNRTLNSTLDRMLTLNRALDEAFNAGRTNNRVWVPAIDAVEKKDAYLMYVELPGVDPSKIDIAFEQNVLKVRGAKHSALDAAKDGEYRVYAAERVTGAFERSIHLPEFVDGEKISAEFTNGVLVVTVPKAKAAQPRRIEVKAGALTHAEIANGTSGDSSNN